MKAIWSILALVATLVLMIGGFFLGQRIAFAHQWPLFEALRSTAAIIFAVVGAWFAIIYPERLKGTFRGTRESNTERDGMSRLFTPIVHSTAILSIVLIIGVVAPLLAHSDSLAPYRVVLRGVSFSILCGLTSWQVITVLMTLDPADALKSKGDAERRRQDAIAAVTSNQTDNND